MRRVRRRLGQVAVIWLLCQVATLALAPTALWPRSVGTLECLCTHGEHAMCPMHHKPAPGSKLCLMRSADDDGTAVLTSLFGTVGLVPAPAPAARPDPRRVIVVADITTGLLQPASPDPPPPRA
jgi:hypothetical protein